tara:strand:+ start:369 stop:527 length:159 start_codon:yes stop_codon:yes gene_type:complete
MPLWLGWTVFAGVGGWAIKQFGGASEEVSKGIVIATAAAVVAPFAIKALKGK